MEHSPRATSGAHPACESRRHRGEEHQQSLRAELRSIAQAQRSGNPVAGALAPKSSDGAGRENLVVPTVAVEIATAELGGAVDAIAIYRPWPQCGSWHNIHIAASKTCLRRTSSTRNDEVGEECYHRCRHTGHSASARRTAMYKRILV